MVLRCCQCIFGGAFSDLSILNISPNFIAWLKKLARNLFFCPVFEHQRMNMFLLWMVFYALNMLSLFFRDFAHFITGRVYVAYVPAFKHI